MNSTQPQPNPSLDVQPSATDSHKGLVKLGIVKRTSTKAVFVECPGLDTIICPDSGRYLDSGATVAGKLNVGDKVEVCLKRQALRNDCSWAAQSTKLIDDAQHVAAAATNHTSARSDPSPSAITSLSSSLLSHSSEGQQSCSHCVDYKKLQEPGLMNEGKSSTTSTLKDCVTETIEDLPSSANSFPLEKPSSKVTNGAKKKAKQGVHNQNCCGRLKSGLRWRRLMSYSKAVLFGSSGGPQATCDGRSTFVAPDSLAQSCEKCCVNNQRPVTSQLRQRCFSRTDSSTRKLSNAGRGSRNFEPSCDGQKQTNRYGPPNRTVWLLSTVFFTGVLLLRNVHGAPIRPSDKLILHAPKDLTVWNGNKAVFQCRTVPSVLPADIQWLFNGSKLRIDGLRILRLRNSDNSLFLAWTAVSDSGKYACLVQSNGSTEMRSAKLTVLSVDSEKDKGNAAFRQVDYATVPKHYDKAIKNAGSGATAALFSNKPAIASVISLVAVVCCTLLVDRIYNDVNMLVARWREGFNQWLPHANAGIADFRRRKNGVMAAPMPNGTGEVKFVGAVGQDTMRRNLATHTVNTRHQCITGQKEYEMKSFEELRVDDYLAGRKGPFFGAAVQTFQPLTNLFGQPQASAPASAGLLSCGAAASSSTADPPLFGGQSTATGGLFGAAATRTSLFEANVDVRLRTSGDSNTPMDEDHKEISQEIESQASQLTATIAVNQCETATDEVNVSHRGKEEKVNESPEKSEPAISVEETKSETLSPTGRPRNGGQDGSNGAANEVLALRDLPPVRVPTFPCIGIVTAVESPHCIYVQQMTNNSRVMQLAADLALYVAANQQASQAAGFVETPGSMFIFVKRSGDDAYRCKLLPTIVPSERYTPYEGRPTLYRVLLIDYGVEMKATAAQLWPLPTEFCADPPYALRCAMVEVGDESTWLTGKDLFAFCYLMKNMYITTGFSVICVFSAPQIAGIDAGVQLVDPQWDNQRVFDLLLEKLVEPYA